MSAIFRYAVGVLSPTVAEDAHGNDRLTYPSVDAAVMTVGWAVDSTGTQEDTDGRRGTLSRVTLRRRGLPIVNASDRLLWLGNVYEIEGDVLYQPGPSALTSHTTVQLKIAKG